MTVSSFSAAQLYGIALEAGLAAAALQAGADSSALDPVYHALDPLAGSSLLGAREFSRLQTAYTHPRDFCRTEAEIILTRLEGRLLGELVAGNALPDEARDLFARRLAGTEPVTSADIEEADRRVRRSWLIGFVRRLGLQPVGFPRHVRRTRLAPFPPLAELLGRPFYLKLESHQPVGSFKNRGATFFLLNALLAGKDPRRIRVGTASHGNHAQGVVRAAHNLGIRNVEILLPRNASPLKIKQLEAMGAKVELFGDTFEEAEDEVRRRAALDPDYLFLPAFDHPLVVAGQGTVGVEIVRQMAAHGHERFGVIAAAGGGGLLAGAATYMSPRGVTVWGAESETHPYISRSFHLSRHRQRETFVDAREIRHVDTVADGIALLRIGRAGFANLVKHVAHVVALPEEEIEAALMFLRDRDIPAEGAAAVPIAALLFGGLPLQRLGVPSDLPIVGVVSGRNIDDDLLREIGERTRRRPWQALRSEFQDLVEDLRQAGYLEPDGSVRTLEDFHDARDFLDRLAAHLPDGWDLLDALSRLHFGPWRGEGLKDINATLRSLGAYQDRWEGNKGLSILHPLGDRGLGMIQGMNLILDGRATLAQLEEPLGLVSRYPRLMTETYLADLLLEREDWLRRLWPHENDESLASRVRHLREVNQGVKTALGQYAALKSLALLSAENTQDRPKTA